MSEEEAIGAVQSRPATVESLTRELATLGVAEGSILLVHSSLRSLGWVCGGPIAVIEALRTAVGDSGTLVMPTQSSDVSDPANWENPPVPRAWWPVIRDSMPAFDAALTPSRGMGLVVDRALPRLFAEVSITARPFFERHGFRWVKDKRVEVRGVMLDNFIMKCPLDRAPG